VGVQVGHLLVRHPFKHWRMAGWAQVFQVLAVRLEQEAKDNKGESMTKDTGRYPQEEIIADTKAFLIKACTDAYDQGIKDGLETVVEVIKEMRPAIRPLEGMGKGKTTEEWFDVLAATIKEKIV